MAERADIATIGPGDPIPSSVHLNPSITPAIGLRPYTVRHGYGNRLLGYAIGVANIQNCVMNGTT